MSLINKQSIEKEDRQRIIISFIRSHKFCNIQSVVEGVQNHVSRVTVFKLLRELIDSGAVRIYSGNNQKKNARDHKLIVDEDNPLISVRLELEEFESAFFDFFYKEIKEFGPQLNAARESGEKRVFYELGFKQSMIIHGLLFIFYSMVDACLVRFLFIWPQKISDQLVLEQLNSMIFSKIADMQARISKTLKALAIVGFPTEKSMEKVVMTRFRGEDSPGPIEKYLHLFKVISKEKEIEPIIDSFWKLIGDLQPSIYPEPRKHDWPFKYGEDDWRKLVFLLRQHRKSIRHSKDRARSSATA